MTSFICGHWNWNFVYFSQVKSYDYSFDLFSTIWKCKSHSWRGGHTKESRVGDHGSLMTVVLAGTALGGQLWMAVDRMLNGQLKGNRWRGTLGEKTKGMQNAKKQTPRCAAIGWNSPGAAGSTAHLCRDWGASHFELSTVRNYSGRMNRLLETGTGLENSAYVCVAVG